MGFPPNSRRGADFMKGSVHWDKKARRYFIAIYWEGRQHRIWRHPVSGEPFWAEKSAEKQLSRIRTEVDDGTFHPRHWKKGAPLLVPAYVETYLSAIRQSVAPGTLAHYQSRLRRHVAPFFSRRDIRAVRYSHLLDFYNHLLESDLKKSTAACVMDALRHMFSFAHRSEDIRSIPPWPKVARENPPIEFLTIEQQELIFGAIPEAHRPIFLFTAEFGLRIGESIALQRDCIRDGMVHIWRTVSRDRVMDRPKARFRSLPLTDFGRAILDDLPPVASPFVFTNCASRSPGMRYSHKALYRHWRRAKKATGIEIPLKNATRHSLGCQLLEMGVDFEAVRQMYGHTSYEMVRRYAERTPATLKTILESRRSGKIVSFGKHSGK